MRAFLIPADLHAAVEEVDVARDVWELPNKIDSEYIERVVVGSIATRVRFPFVLVVDEEGALTQKPKNIRASLLYGSDIHGGTIYGDALLLGEGMTAEGPDFIDLPAHVTIHNLSDYLYEPKNPKTTEALMGS